MPTNIYTVYRVTNKVNQKIYVGFTEKSLRDRWLRHINDSKKMDSRLFMRALRKYGRDAFEMEAIYQSEDKLDALEKEEYFIREWKANHKKVGYNCTFGGENTFALKGKDHPFYGLTGEANHNYGRRLSPEEREAIRKSRQAFFDNGGEPWNKGKKGLYKWSENQRKLHTENRSGENHWGYGKKYSAEHRRKISEAAKKRPNHLNGEKKDEYRAKQVATYRKRNPMYRQEMIDLVWGMRQEGYTAQYISDCVSAFIPKSKNSIESYLRIYERDRLFLQ